MARHKLVFLGYIFATISVGFACAQTRLPVLKQPHSRPVPTADQFGVSPFALESRSQDEFRVIPQQRMEPADVKLLALSEAELHRQADFFDLDYNGNGWSISQFECPGFPNHLFLRMERNKDRHDVTIFSASIPRNGSGQVRLIPILRRSSAMFTPASRNPVSIAGFNRILAEEKAPPKPFWVDVASCYVALLGADPEAGATASDTEDSEAGWQRQSILALGKAREVMRLFTSQPRPLAWRLVFDNRGKLLEAGATPAIERIDILKPSSR